VVYRNCKQFKRNTLKIEKIKNQVVLWLNKLTGAVVTARLGHGEFGCAGASSSKEMRRSDDVFDATKRRGSSYTNN